MVFSLLRMLGALAIVIAFFLGAVWLFRNWQRLTIQRGRAPKLNVLEVRSLGPRHSLYVVGYEQQRFLLSSAPTGISMLTVLPPASTTEPEAPTLVSATFGEVLTKAMSSRFSKGGALPS